MIRCAFALLLLIASQTQADVIRVQTGDHPGFTRLVLAIPAGRDWHLGRQGDGYLFETGNPTDSFGLESAFDIIGRERVAGLDLAARPGGLNITLACTCHATAFRWQTAWVVVDIVDGPPPAGSPYEGTIDVDDEMGPTATQTADSSLRDYTIALPTRGLTNFTLDPAAPSTQPAAMSLVLPLVMAGHSEVDLPAIIPPGLRVTPNVVGAEAPTHPAQDDQISVTEQAIIESFARAASQGLLDISAAPEHRSDPSLGPVAQPALPHGLGTAENADPITATESHGDLTATPPHPVEGAPSMLAGFDLQAADPNQPGIISHTSVDRELPPVDQTDASTAAGNSCLDESLLNVQDWGDERDFSTQIGESLSMLTTEFDVYPDGAVEDLVRNYIYFGFGSEALQALDLDGADSQPRRVMAAMAHITDEEPDPSGLFDSQLGCATQAAIWTVLSRQSLEGTTEAERIAAIAGFRTLPPMLRGHLGVKLAQIFVNFGDPESAKTILEAARGHVTADRATTDVTAAEITLETLGAEAAIPELGEMAAADIRLTPDALVQLINLTLDAGKSLDPSLISLADSMLYEHRGEVIGAALIAAEARALTAEGAYSQAFALLDGDVAPMAYDQLATLRSTAILDLTNRADDPAFLNFAFDALPETGNAKIENAVATRLLALGFAERAGALLTNPALGAEARDRRYIEADIALALGDFEGVERILGGMSDPRAADIKARGLTAQGDFAAASSAQNALPGAATDPAGAWRAGEWSVLEQSEDPLLRAASDAVLSSPEALDPETPLAASRALLDQATATQDLAGQLLDRFAVEPATAEPAAN